MTDTAPTPAAEQPTDLDFFMRLDALIGQLVGGLRNDITGEGSSSDRINGWVPQAAGVMSMEWLVQAYAGIPWARLICEKPARWLQQAGIRVEQADGLPDAPAEPASRNKKRRKPRPRGPADVLALDETYGLTSSLGRSYGWARMLGGAAVVIDAVGDDDWSQPWIPRQGQEVRLHPYDGISIQPVQKTQGSIREPGLPDIWQRFQRHDRPRYYRILQTAYTDGSRRDVHWTRVMPMLGMELPPGGAYMLTSGYRVWPALSIIEHCWQQIRAYGAMDAGIERIMAVLAIWVMVLPSLPSLQSGAVAGATGTNGAGQSGAEAMIAAIVNRMRAGGVFMGAPGSTVTPASLSLSGIGDLDSRTKGSLAAASDCPQFVIFGEDKGGLAAGSANAMPTSLRVWTTNLSGWWDDQWSWNIQRFLTGACVVKWGTAPTELRVKVGAFIPTTEAEEMAIRKDAASEAAELVREGIWKASEAHRRYEGGFTVDFQIDAAEETEEEGAAATGTPAPAGPGSEAVADLALNGAQTESLLSVLTEGGTKRLTPEGKMLVIRASFPAISEETARAMAAQVLDVEPSGTPSPGPAPAALPTVDTRGDADFGGTAYLYLDLGAEGLSAWRDLQTAASAIVALEGYDPGDAAPTEPHVTLLYLGTVRTRDQKAALAAATGILAGERLPELRPVGVTLFGDAGIRQPVVAELASAGVKRLHNALLRALAPWVAEVQHPTYRAHVTLGFATVTSEQADALEELPVPASLGAATAACCTWDGSRVLALPTRP